MSSKVPTSKLVSWVSIIPQLLIMGLIMLLWYQFEKTNFIIYGAISYLIMALLLRRLFAADHRKGMVKVKSEEYEKGTPIKYGVHKKEQTELIWYSPSADPSTFKDIKNPLD